MTDQERIAELERRGSDLEEWARYANEMFKAVKDFNGSTAAIITQLVGLPPKP